VRPTLRAKAFAAATAGLVTLSGDVSPAIGDPEGGLIARAGVDVSLPFVPGWFFAIGGGATYVDERRARALYGIDAAQSAASGLAEFDASGGLQSIDASLVAPRQLTSRWRVSIVHSRAWLRGAARVSPVTETRALETTVVAVGFRFR
jgi:outer membrane scaffolding protein for murein synthesis (MipA/OmpV family)